MILRNRRKREDDRVSVTCEGKWPVCPWWRHNGRCTRSEYKRQAISSECQIAWCYRKSCPTPGKNTTRKDSSSYQPSCGQTCEWWWRKRFRFTIMYKKICFGIEIMLCVIWHDETANTNSNCRGGMKSFCKHITQNRNTEKQNNLQNVNSLVFVFFLSFHPFE